MLIKNAMSALITLAKKKIKITIALSIFLIIILFFFWTEWRFDTANLGNGRTAIYSRNYKDYYYKSKSIHTSFLRSVYYKKVYFLPGQKDKLLRKIEEDIEQELKETIEKNSDVFYEYEIDDVFMQVCIYVTSKDAPNFNEISSSIRISIRTKLDLYSRVKNGHWVDDRPIIRLIEN